MITDILQWTSTFFFIFGAIFYSSTKASNPKTRIRGFTLFEVGSAAYIVCNIYLALWGFVLTQIVFAFIDLRGIINCYKEIKNA